MPSVEVYARQLAVTVAANHNEVFRGLFASFLRRHGDAWRVRRRDYLVPLGFDLARRQITVQGQIGANLLEQFLDEQNFEAPKELLRGESFVVYLPFAALPKRVLLNFTTQAPDGARLPLLTRSQGAAVTADHLYLVLTRDRLADLGDERKRIAALLALQAFVATNPIAFAAEVARWDQWSMGIDRAGLFRRWFVHQLTSFSSDMQTAATTSLADRIDQLRKSHPIVLLESENDDSETNPYPFKSVADVIVWGLREYLNVLLEVDDPERSAPPQIPVLREALIELLPLGIEVLHDLRSNLAASAETDAGAKALLRAFDTEMRTAAVSWMAYIAAPITLSEPFHFRTSEVLPLRQRESLRLRQPLRWIAIQLIRFTTKQTYHVYPLDARSFHVEIATEDPELVIDSSATWVRHGATYSRPAEIFHEEYQQSEHIAHFYTASTWFQKPFRGMAGPIEISTRFKLASSQVAGYVVAVFALVADLVWSTWEWCFTDPNGTTRIGLLTIGVGFVGLALFFLSSQGSGAIVRGKLEIVRFAVYVVLTALIVEPFINWALR